MADAGARKIKDLLDTPSQTLQTHMKAVRTGMAATSGDDGAVRSSTYRSISAVLSYYRRLHVKVEDTKTKSAAKKDVTAALFQIEAALASLSEGIKRGTADNAGEQLDKAQRRAARGVSVEQMLAQWGQDQTLLGRLPTLAQVADAAVFLASDRAGAITGAVADLTCGSAVRAQQFGQALIGVLD